MVEIVLILSLGAWAAVLAAVLTRWVLSQALGSSETARVLGAVRRAGDDFAWKQGKRALLAVALVAVVLLGVGTVAKASPEAESNMFTWMAASLAVGASCSLLVGQLAVQVAPRASARVATAMLRATHSHAVAVGLRAGAAVALGVEALTLLLVSAVFSFVGVTSPHCPAVLLGLSVGAVLAAFWAQITGGAVHYAGQVGRRELRLGSQRERFDMDMKNPTMVLDLVGNHVGVSATRTQDVFCTSLLLHAAAVSVASWLWAGGGSSVDPSLFIALPILMRGFGLFAAGITIVSSRADESDEPSAILWRGQLAVASLCLTCVAGLGIWLLGDSWVPWFTSAAIGIGASLLVGFARQHLTDRRRAGLKELKQVTAVSPGLALASGATCSMYGAWPTLLVLGLALSLGSMLGQASGLPLGTVLALDVLVAGFSMSLPFLASLTLFDPIVDGGCALASLDAQRRPEVKHRSVRMNQAALSAGAVGRAHLLVVSALLGVLAVVHLSRGAATLGDAAAQSGNITVLSAGAVLGLALVLGFGGAAVLHATRTASEVTLELQRQLEGFVRDKHGTARLPDEFRPRYNEHLSFVCQRALRAGAFAPLSALLFPPVLVAAVPRLWDSGPAQTVLLLMALLTLTTVCGFVVALTAEGVWSLVSAARRHTRATDPGQLGALNLVDGLAEFAGNTISPSAQLAAKAVLAMSLSAALVLF